MKIKLFDPRRCYRPSRLARGKSMVRRLKPFMAVEEKSRGNDELYDIEPPPKFYPPERAKFPPDFLFPARLLFLSLYEFVLDYSIVYTLPRHIKQSAHPRALEKTLLVRKRVIVFHFSRSSYPSILKFVDRFKIGGVYAAGTEWRNIASMGVGAGMGVNRMFDLDSNVL